MPVVVPSFRRVAFVVKARANRIIHPGIAAMLRINFSMNEAVIAIPQMTSVRSCQFFKYFVEKFGH